MLKKLFRALKPFSQRKRFSSFIEDLIGVAPKNIKFYKTAFIHKSSTDKQRDGLETNERLEYLGDAILGAVIALELYTRYPNEDEGFLTKTRSKIVNRAALNAVGKSLGLDSYITAQSSLSFEKTHILGDALEAIIGAIFVDRGYEATRKFIVQKILTDQIDVNALIIDDGNYKSNLIEYCQRFKLQIAFETEEHPYSKSGVPEFIAVVIVNGEVRGHGNGASKKEAQQMASKEALDYFTKKENTLRI